VVAKDEGEDAFMSARDVNFPTPGGNVGWRRRRPEDQTEAMARASAGSSAGRRMTVGN